MEAGVEIETSELREKPQGAFPTKFKARQRAAGVTTSVDAQTLQRLLEQQNSLAKFVREQFEWQKKVSAYVTKGKMVIEEPVLPEWMQEEEEDNIPLSSMNIRAVKQEKAKRARSVAEKGKSPAKKKQKKVSSEEEANEPEKASVEVLSDEEEEEQVEEEGSSSDKTDIQADSPPTPKQTIPQHSEPTTHTQNISSTPQSKQQNQPSPQPSPIQPQPEKQPSQQLPNQEKPSGDVITSEATAAASNPETQPLSPPKKLRVKSVPKRNPFGRKTRQELAAVSEETSAPADVVAEGTRAKLPVKKKSVAPKGKRATATSAAFAAASASESVPAVAAEEEAADMATSAEKEAAARLVELQASKEQEEAQDKVIAAGDVSTDVTTSIEPEVEKAPVDPKEPAPAMKAWEEAKKRIAEASTQRSQETETSAATSTMAGSEETTTAAEAGEEKKKKEKKKKADQSGIPPRHSARLRSGALNK